MTVLQGRSQGCPDWDASWRHTPSNIFKFALKLVKRQPCCKRVGNTIFPEVFFFSNNSWPIGQHANPPPHQMVSRHITGRSCRGGNVPPNRKLAWISYPTELLTWRLSSMIKFLPPPNMIAKKGFAPREPYVQLRACCVVWKVVLFPKSTTNLISSSTPSAFWIIQDVKSSQFKLLFTSNTYP